MALRYVEDEDYPDDYVDEHDKAAMLDLLTGQLYYRQWYPAELLAVAESSDCLTELLQVPEAAYLLPYQTLVTQIRSHIRIDDKLQFASFLRDNRDLVLNYPAVYVLRLLCWRSAVGCAAALLEDPHLCVDVDVNYKYKCGSTALHIAASKPSYAMTSLLLHHGADPNLGASTMTGTPLQYALFLNSRSKDFSHWTPQKSFLKLFNSFCMPELKKPFDTIRLLASHTKNVEDICFKWMHIGEHISYAFLLIGAWDKLMVSSSTEGGLETTPVWQHISRVLSNPSLQQEICDDSGCLSKDKLVKNLTIALDVVKTMWMDAGDHWCHSRAENVPMHRLPPKSTREHMKAAGSGGNIMCLRQEVTLEAKELPKRNCTVKQGRPVLILRSFTWKPKPKPKTAIGTISYLSPSSFHNRSVHLPETAQVKPSSCNVIPLTRLCSSLM